LAETLPILMMRPPLVLVLGGLSECSLFFAAFLAGVRHSNLTWTCRDAIERAALSAFALYASVALLDGEGFTLQGFFDQTFGFVAHRLL